MLWGLEQLMMAHRFRFKEVNYNRSGRVLPTHPTEALTGNLLRRRPGTFRVFVMHQRDKRRPKMLLMLCCQITIHHFTVSEPQKECIRRL